MNLVSLRRSLGGLSLRAKAFIAVLVALAMGAALFARAGAARADDISTIRVVTTGACLDTATGYDTLSLDAPVFLAPCNGANTQNWRFIGSPWSGEDISPAVLIQNAATGYCLVAHGGGIRQVSSTNCGDFPEFDQEFTPVFGLQFAFKEGGYLTDDGRGGLMVNTNGENPGPPATWFMPGKEDPVPQDGESTGLSDPLSGGFTPLSPAIIPPAS
ncbi:hypothetical protein SAMN05892883_4198 [Jatrophihabitans sp. GAS493]|uniref:hypothetical protein n=1 Tax=Jatrophihabitans sp. GAS493 TaxID=1907575 RepID=UPI000BBF8C2B|nr:hypothetical protein [Jatrophihabitans sp. GAS493]SOD75000.1 hypothetical protein SAMN05892883_4198 [Jatrophihabitans sp. GAS493]